MRFLLFLLPFLCFAQAPARIAAEIPYLDSLFAKQFADAKYPGLVYGIVADGRLVHSKSFGVRDLGTQAPVTAQSVFRIASMTKSFTALCILKLRDAGKLSLEDPITKYIPAARTLRGPTTDSPALTIRHLLTHSAGFPEDNPWGDRQLAISEEQLDRWLAQGLPFSTAPGTAYEYSNYGFALLGRIVARASGQSYRAYLEAEILRPLGMTQTFLEAAEVPAAHKALGYGRRSGEAFLIPSLGHGAFGAMGGLHTSAEDLAKYVAFQLSAYPPRDGAEAGPVRRASVREMQQMQRFSNLRGPSAPAAAIGYGYGLGVSQDCRFAHIVGHGGGLPGFGSYMMWLPDYGVGIFAMANLTYASTTSTIRASLEHLARKGAIAPRPLPLTPLLLSMQNALFEFWKQPDAGALDSLAADNLYQDQPRALLLRAVEEIKGRHRGCSAGPLQAENLLRGVFRLTCEGGPVDVSFTLAPTQPPKIQYLGMREVKEEEPVGMAPRCTP